MALNDFFVWLISGGGAIIAVSWLVERWPWFQSQVASTKELILWLSSSVLSVGAYCAVNYIPQETLDKIAPFFLIVSGIFITVMVGKTFHSADKKV